MEPVTNQAPVPHRSNNETTKTRSIREDGGEMSYAVQELGDEITRLRQALAKKDRELELADFTIKESLEKIAAMDKEIQQIREHEFQRGYQEAEEKYQQILEKSVKLAEEYRDAEQQQTN